MSELVQRILAALRDKVLECFQLQRDDRLIIVTDDGVDPDVRDALGRLNRMYEFDLLATRAPTGPGQAFTDPEEGILMLYNAWLLVTSMSRTHCVQVKKAVNPEAPIARVISTSGRTPEVFLEGAVNEDLGEMRARVERIRKLCEGTERFLITDNNGTNIVVVPWLECGTADAGLITKPGDLGNYPVGEYCWAVRPEGTNGIMVSAGVMGAGIGYPDARVTFQVLEGRIIKIWGGKSAQRLTQIMDAADQEARRNGLKIKKPSYVLAEVAFGANSKAWRVNPSGTRILPPTSLEGEKAYHPQDTTMHIAHGANHIFGMPKSDPWYNPVGHHTDHILMGRLNVVAEKPDGSHVVVVDEGVPSY